MNTTRMAILAVALVAGIFCVGIVLRGMASARRAQPVVIAAPVVAHPTVQVLVASRDLQVGEKIGPEDMAWQTWPADALNPAFITDGPPTTAPTGQLAGKIDQAASAVKTAMNNPAQGAGASLVASIVRERILAKEPILRSKLVHPGAGGVMAVTLDPGMRAVALPLTAESAAGGFILPGDHVDVMLTRSLDSAQSPGGGASAQTHSTSTVMRNVRVLAIDQNIGAPKAASAEIGATATVECTPDQAEYLVQAKASGTLTLMLRSYADAAGGAEIGGPRHAGADRIVRVFRANGAASAVTVSQ